MKTDLFSSAPAVFSLLSIFLVACVSHDLPGSFDCDVTDLTIELVTRSNPTDCDRENGTIEVSATGGKPPYQFRLGSAPLSSLSLFSELAPPVLDRKSVV